MSDITYDQNYKGIQGVNYPPDGTVFYQQDFMKEQEDIGGEIIDRESDYFTVGVIEGFVVSVSATAGCIDITAGIARDPLGRRVIASALAAQAVPDLQTTILAISHVWNFEPYILDGTNVTKYRRKHSSSFGFYTVGNVPVNAVQLFKVQRSGSTVTILEDLRKYARLKDSGAVPVGSIVARIPGYFSNGNNGSYTAVALSLPSNWKICDGSLCNDSDSPIFNGAGRYLPNLTDSRFIMGSTLAAAGQIGGNAGNQVTLSEANLPAHAHTIAHTHTFSGTTSNNGSHSHTVQCYWSNGIAGYYMPTESGTANPSNPATSAAGDHTHTFSGATSNPSATDSGSVGSGTAFSILPKYLTAVYLMRIK